MTTGLTDPAFWHGRRVLLTGHTGFKGGWLAIWLHRLGAQVTGLGLPPDTSPSLFRSAGVDELLTSTIADVRDLATVTGLVRTARPEVVFHLAAQPLVSDGFRTPVDTFSTNVMGTVNVLEAVRDTDTVRSVVVVTSDKVYRPVQHGSAPAADENAVLGGADPYSASKAAAEMVSEGYRGAFLAAQGTALSTVRAGNVLGGGDWARDRLVPDAIRAWANGRPLALRRPNAMRPWQHVLEPASAYLRIAQQQFDEPALGDAYNVGPATSHTVSSVIELARSAPGTWPTSPEVASATGPPDFTETDRLEIDASLVAKRFGITPRWDMSQTLDRTMAWYREFSDGADARSLCLADIDAYEGA